MISSRIHQISGPQPLRIAAGAGSRARFRARLAIRARFAHGRRPVGAAARDFGEAKHRKKELALLDKHLKKVRELGPKLEKHSKAQRFDEVRTSEMENREIEREIERDRDRGRDRERKKERETGRALGRRKTLHGGNKC